MNKESNTTETAIDANTVLTTVDFNARIIETPHYQRWGDGNIDYCRFDGKINYEGLSDHQKLYLYIYAWNIVDILQGKKGILRTFGWTNYKLQKLIKELKGVIPTDFTFSEHTGLLSGRGYIYCC